MDITTITLSRDIKNKLDRLKSHPRESYNEVIAKILAGKTKIDYDSLKETIDILSDPSIMKSLAKSLDDLKKGNIYSIDEV